MASRGGVLLRIEDRNAARLAFIASEVAERLALLSCMTAVIGLRPPAWGLALADGELVTVLSLGEGASATEHAAPPGRPHGDPGVEPPGALACPAVLSDVGGTRVALTGGTIVATGLFSVDARGAVRWEGEPGPCSMCPASTRRPRRRSGQRAPRVEGRHDAPASRVLDGRASTEADLRSRPPASGARAVP